ncbi:LysR family transcriptional regulator [Lachnospiraceae bacterium C1.1]
MIFLLYVIALKDEKNISAAARKLGISQPTLSEFLSNLENELGTDLFYREKRKLELTPSGKIYIDAAQRIMQIRDRTYSSIHKLRNPTKSTIRIAASPLRGSAKFASIFPKFSRRYPDIELQLTEAYTAQIPDMLTSEAIDLALGTFSDTDSKDFDFITCSYEEIVLAIPSYLKNS